MSDYAAIRRLVDSTYAACVKFLADEGRPDPILVAARRVVWARYYGGDDGWDKLKAAIGELEDVVGRPEHEP